MVAHDRPNPSPPPAPLILIGGGGHALVVAEAALLLGLPLRGFLDDDPGAALSAGNPVATPLGPLSESLRVVSSASHGTGWILALGDLALRRRMLAELASHTAAAVTIIHPTAFVSPSARLGRGVYVGPHAVVHTRARIADHAIINSAAVIEHDCSIGENTHIAPAAALGGNCRVGVDTLIGLGARVVPGLEIGARCTVGAGAVVIRAVAEGSTVYGVPAGAARREKR
jgi:sugar O-acyltransferase (sialic acid O-acetyltransferase NeuD family)